MAGDAPFLYRAFCLAASDDLLPSKVLMPLAQILFFTFLGSTHQAHRCGLLCDWQCDTDYCHQRIFGVTMSIGGDRWTGTLPYLFGTPANRLMLFFGRAFMHILDGTLGVVMAWDGARCSLGWISLKRICLLWD